MDCAVVCMPAAAVATDDAVDAALKIVGQTLHRRATLRRGAALRFRLDGFKAANPRRYP
jgi:hypothetical protein